MQIRKSCSQRTFCSPELKRTQTQGPTQSGVSLRREAGNQLGRCPGRHTSTARRPHRPDRHRDVKCEWKTKYIKLISRLTHLYKIDVLFLSDTESIPQRSTVRTVQPNASPIMTHGKRKINVFALIIAQNSINPGVVIQVPPPSATEQRAKPAERHDQQSDARIQTGNAAHLYIAGSSQRISCGARSSPGSTAGWSTIQFMMAELA